MGVTAYGICLLDGKEIRYLAGVAWCYGIRRMPTTLMGVNPEAFDHIRIQLKPQSRTVRHFDTSIRLNR